MFAVLIPLEDSQGNAAAERSYLTLSGLLPSCGYWGKRTSSMQADVCWASYVVMPNSATVCGNNISCVHVNLQPESQIILKHP